MQTPEVKSQTVSPVTKRPSHVRKDLGMLMFLLAAETAVVSSQITDAVAIAEGVRVDSTKIVAYSDSSSDGETDSRTNSPDEELHFEFPSVEGKHATRLLVLDGAIVALVLSFVPWRKAARLRAVNRAWLSATENIVQIRHLPGTAVRAAFLPCPKNLDQDTEAESALQFLHPNTWRCVVCGFWNAETRVLCGNRHCQSPSLTHAGCARIFLGQLRRDGTVPFIQWMVTRVIEAPSDLRNVENHRHNITNRGKGCAWAYFKSEEVANELLAYHRRMFLDQVDGVEGVWIVRKEDVNTLQDVASERGYAPSRPKCLPRNALVVEPPATGSTAMGRDLLNSDIQVHCQYYPEQYADQLPADTPLSGESGVKSSVAETETHTATQWTAPSAGNNNNVARFHHDPYSFAPVSTECTSYVMSDEGPYSSFPASAYGDYYYGVSTGYDAAGASDASCPPPAYDETLQYYPEEATSGPYTSYNYGGYYY